MLPITQYEGCDVNNSWDRVKSHWQLSPQLLRYIYILQIFLDICSTSQSKCAVQLYGSSWFWFCVNLKNNCSSSSISSDDAAALWFLLHRDQWWERTERSLCDSVADSRFLWPYGAPCPSWEVCALEHLVICRW